MNNYYYNNNDLLGPPSQWTKSREARETSQHLGSHRVVGDDNSGEGLAKIFA